MKQGRARSRRYKLKPSLVEVTLGWYLLGTFGWYIWYFQYLALYLFWVYAGRGMTSMTLGTFSQPPPGKWNRHWSPALQPLPSLPFLSFSSPPGSSPSSLLLPPMNHLIYQESSQQFPQPSNTMTVPLTKVDSAIAGLSIHDEKPPASTEKEVKGSKKEPKDRRASSAAEAGVWKIEDLGMFLMTDIVHRIMYSLSPLQRNKRLKSPFPLKHKRPDGKSIPTLTPHLNPDHNHNHHPTSESPFTVSNHPLRKLNTSPSTIEDKDILKMKLVNPPVRKIDLHFPLGLEVTARNSKGVTIKDALDAIHKRFKKKV